ncbi:MAG TPA: phage tail protein [Pyrinomonadaceae bacterium]|jgi:hypothetical protein
MAQLAILAAITVGSVLLENAFTSKPKQKPVDVGRFDDIRIQTSEENGFKPRIYGLVRLAGNLIDHTVTQEHVTHTPGSSGGKGGGGHSEPTPAQNNFSYTKTFALSLCEGPVSHIVRAWEDADVIFNYQAIEFLGGTLYQAESGTNTRTGGASVVSQANCSGGAKVTGISNGGSLRFNNVVAAGPGWYRIRLSYMSSGVRIAKMSINGGAAEVITFPSTGSDQVLGVLQLDLELNNGANTLRFYNDAGEEGPDIDALRLVALTDPYAGDGPGDVTGGINDYLDYPNNPHNPSHFYNHMPLIDQTGMAETRLLSGGQAPFRFYRGTEDQLQDPALVALHGAANTPAYRGTATVVFEEYQVKNGRLGNFTFLVEQGMHDLSEIVANEYSLAGLPASRLDVSQLADTWVEGYVVDTRKQTADIINDLQLWFDFDVVDVDGLVRAVRRGGVPVLSIPEAELSAHEFGSERPLGPVRTVYANEQELPRQVDVAYLDPGKEYHTGVQPAQRGVGNSLEPVSLSFPIVSDADTAQQVGLRYLYGKHLARTPREWEAGPKYAHLIPTDIVELVLTGTTHQLRITNQQQALLGLGKYKGLPEKTSVYTQVMGGYSGGGSEQRPTEFPANTMLWMGDLPPLRLEDDALGYYVAVCPAGAGNWRGAHLRKEVFADEYHRVTSFDRAAIMGHVEGVLPSVSDLTAVDRTSEVFINLLYGTLESREESELMEQAVNVAVMGTGQNMEVIQFSEAIPETPTAPYVARYRVRTFLRGRFGTEYAMAGHTDGEPFVLLTDAVKFRREEPTAIQATTKFKAVTVAQAERDAAEYEFYFTGKSLQPLSPANLRGRRDSRGGLLIEFEPRTRAGGGLRPNSNSPTGEEKEEYRVEILSADWSTVLRTMPVYVGTPLAAALESRNYKFIEITGNSLSLGSPIDDTKPPFKARSLQSISQAGNFIEATLSIPSNAVSFSAANFGVIPADEPWRTLFSAIVPEVPLAVSLSTGLGPDDYYLTVYEAGVSTGISLLVPPDPRVRFTFSGTELRVYYNWTGLGSSPLYSITIPDRYPFHAFAAAVNDYAAVKDMFMTTIPYPKTLYSHAQQVKDFGSVQESVNVRVYQMSTLVGAGQKTEGIL